MKEQLAQIPQRIRELREVLDISAESMAEKLHITPNAYAAYERDGADIPISALYDIAAALDTDFTVLLTGEAPRMDSLCVVRAGEGIVVERFSGYGYESLAYNFMHRDMEPMLVRLSAQDHPAPPVCHGGQEFNYCLSGKIRVTVGKREVVLQPGDSIYFDPRLPHGQTAVDGDASFLTVINE